MGSTRLTRSDREELLRHGLTVEAAVRQLELLAHGRPPVRLVRPCTIGDGIVRLEAGEVDRLIDRYRALVDTRAAVSFVPASGAATRMFKSLITLRSRPACERSRQMLSRSAATGDADAIDAMEFVDHLDRFAFAAALRAAAERQGLAWPPKPDDDLAPLIDLLLEPRGLGYATLPKGLLAFHRYVHETRTAFEEHLAEAARLVRDQSGRCRAHFTVSVEHRGSFHRLLDERRGAIETRQNVHLDVEFSEQSASSDSLAVDSQNRPFRSADGRLVFRPGGHGALIENLARLDADCVFIKNIDNVAPEWAAETVVRWRQVLGGLLLDLQSAIFECLDALESVGTGQPPSARSRAVLRSMLGIDVPGDVASASPELVSMLDRPLRVCAMVRNTGEPGGGPFWVEDRDGRASRQIVEGSQVAASADQQEILRSSTHFNPVDLVCALRDRSGSRYELSRFVDPEAVFLVEKSSDRRTLRSVELPGLWNGAMAGWLTVFVEVPVETFRPVKKVTDLLRPEHCRD